MWPERVVTALVLLSAVLGVDGRRGREPAVVPSGQGRPSIYGLVRKCYFALRPYYTVWFGHGAGNDS